MSALLSFFQQPWVERLGWTLVHFLWQGALISLLFAMLRSITTRAQSRYVLACIALLAMLAAPLLTFGILAGGKPLPAEPAAVLPVSAAASGNAVAATGWRVPAGGPWRQCLPWIVMIWLGGAIAFLIRLIGGWAVAARLRSVATRPAPAEWQETLDGLMRRIGVTRTVRLLVSPLVQVPAVIGWLRPVVLVPVGALTGLPSENVEALLAHELAHILRNDYLANLLQSVTEALLFYHPAVWWVSGQIRMERELCCDDIAVTANGDAFKYARALAELESFRPAHVQTTVAANGGSLQNRISRLLDPARRVSHAPSGPAAALAVSVLLLAGVGALTVHGAQEPVTRGYATEAAEPDGPGVTVNLSGAGVMHRPPVQYPGSAIERNVAGTVVAEVALDAKGGVNDVRIVSGPVELRRTVLQSVLQWHFTPGAPGVTREVSVTFQLPAQPDSAGQQQAAPERPSVSVLRQGAVETRSAEGPGRVNFVGPAGPGQAEFYYSPRTEQGVTRRGGEPVQSQEQNREEIHQFREPSPNIFRFAPEGQTVEAQIEVLRQQREVANPEQGEAIRRQISELERTLRTLQSGRAAEAPLVARSLASIEIRGMSDEAGNDLLGRLPIHEGDTLTSESVEATRRLIREFDEHLESGFENRDGRVVLRIHPAGSAGAPLLRRK
jgi:TonB family protein